MLQVNITILPMPSTILQFFTPTPGNGDWVLVLDDVTKGFPFPKTPGLNK